MCLPKTVLVLSIRKKEGSKMRLVEIPDDGIVSEYIWAGDSVVGIRRFDLSYLPTIEAEPVRHGRWVEKVGLFDEIINRCSVCEEDVFLDGESIVGLYNYCPNCGAKMDGGGDK